MSYNLFLLNVIFMYTTIYIIKHIITIHCIYICTLYCQCLIPVAYVKINFIMGDFNSIKHWSPFCNKKIMTKKMTNIYSIV